VQTFSFLTLACITRIAYAAAWQSMVSASPDSEHQLTRLGQIIGELESSIPTGTVARQFKPRSSDESVGNHGHGRQSSPGAKPKRAITRSSSANSQTTTVSAESRTLHKDDNPASLTVLSAIMQQLHAVADPRALMSAAPSQRLVSRRGIEPTLAAAGKRDVFRHPHSNNQIPICRTSLSRGLQNVDSDPCPHVVMLDNFVHDPMSPMTSFDQLWAQATLLRGSLLQKVAFYPPDRTRMFNLEAWMRRICD
jgi:hypothetical protein